MKRLILLSCFMFSGFVFAQAGAPSGPNNNGTIGCVEHEDIKARTGLSRDKNCEVRFGIDHKIRGASQSLSANAKLTPECQTDMIESAQKYVELFEVYAAGEFNKRQLEVIAKGRINVAESQAQLCKGLKLIELEKSFRGRLGLLSKKKAQIKAQAVYDAAIELFNAEVDLSL